MSEKNDISALKSETKKTYPINNVYKGFRYWVRVLCELCIGMFDYENVPSGVPITELEFRIITEGYGVIFKRDNPNIVGQNLNKMKIGATFETSPGEFATAYGSLSGVNEYYHPTRFIFSQPVLGSGNLKIGTDCAIFYNSAVDEHSAQPHGFLQHILRTAAMLAHIDSSIAVVTVNRRAIGLGVATDQRTAKAVDNVFTRLKAGEYSTLNQDTIIDAFKVLPFDANTRLTLTELTELKDNVLKGFYSFIGIKTAVNKRERVISDEVAVDNQLLMVNVNDMLEFRQRGCDMFNNLFGGNMSVKLKKDYNPDIIFQNIKGGADDDYS